MVRIEVLQAYDFGTNLQRERSWRKALLEFIMTSRIDALHFADVTLQTVELLFVHLIHLIVAREEVGGVGVLRHGVVEKSLFVIAIKE